MSWQRETPILRLVECDIDAPLLAFAKAQYAFRRRREAIFGLDIFAEPAWDMLLDLYIQRGERRAVSRRSPLADRGGARDNRALPAQRRCRRTGRGGGHARAPRLTAARKTPGRKGSRAATTIGSCLANGRIGGPLAHERLPQLIGVTLLSAFSISASPCHLRNQPGETCVAHRSPAPRIASRNIWASSLRSSATDRRKAGQARVLRSPFAKSARACAIKTRCAAAGPSARAAATASSRRADRLPTEPPLSPGPRP